MTDKWTPDNSVMPITFESAKRVNSSYYPGWGIQEGSYRSSSDALYTKEWKGGPGQMRNVAKAAVDSGLGSFSVSLRNSVARVAAYMIHNADGPVRLIDIGAGSGGSIKPVYSQLPKDEWDKVYSLLVDPSKKNVKAAKAYLENTLGLKEGKHFDFERGRDIDLPKIVNEGYFDIAMQVAAMHHHAYLENAFKAVSYALKKGKVDAGKPNDTQCGGVFVSGDWHSRIWENPAMVYRWLLQRMDWPQKEEGMQSFLKQFPHAAETIEKLGCYDKKNMEVFSRYWNTWNMNRQKMLLEGTLKPDEDFYAMEGHCPPEIYSSEMTDAGFLLDTPLIRSIIAEGLMDDNPHQVYPDHNLNMVIAAQPKSGKK